MIRLIRGLHTKYALQLNNILLSNMEYSIIDYFVKNGHESIDLFLYILKRVSYHILVIETYN